MEQQIKQMLTKVFSDTSVPEDVTREILEGLREEIDMLLETLD